MNIALPYGYRSILSSNKRDCRQGQLLVPHLDRQHTKAPANDSLDGPLLAHEDGFLQLWSILPLVLFALVGSIRFTVVEGVGYLPAG